MAKERVEVEILTEVKKSLSSLAKYTAAITGVTLAVGKVIKTVSDMTDEYKQAVIAETKLEAAIRATGGAVGITKDEMMDYAVSLSRATGIGDDALIGAQGLMTTFTKIGKDVFPDAIEAAADMSVMFGQDLQQSVIQLGTALNDPIAGVGRLRRIGISFTEDQQALIKSLVEENDLLGAQQVILDELGVEIGGTAKLMGTTAVGAVNSLNEAWANLKEEGGKTILEFIKPAVIKLTELINKTVDARKEYENWKDAVSGDADADYVSALEKQVALVESLEKALQDNASSANNARLIERGYGGYIIEANEALTRRLTIEKDKLELMKMTNHELEKQRVKEAAIAKILKEKADAEEEAQKHLDALNEAYDKTLPGQIEIAQAQIKYFEAFREGPRAVAVLEGLRKKLAELQEQLYGKKENPFAGMQDWADEIKAEAQRIRQSNYFSYLEDMLGGEDTTASISLFSDHDARVATALINEFYDNLADRRIISWEQARGLQQEENDLFAAAMINRAELIEKETELRRREAQEMINQYGKFAEAMGVLLVDQEKGIDALKNAFKDLIISQLKALAIQWTANAIMNAAVNPVAAAGYAAGAIAATAGIGVVSALGDGGLVTGPTAAIVGERGPELVTPLSDLGKLGGDTIIVNVQGSLIHERNLEDMIVGAMGAGTRGY